jgi:hypothetical protein
MNNPNAADEPDYFSEVSHPEVFKEIKEMAYQVCKVPGSFKREILTSFLRSHSINADWLDGNDILVQLITSGSLKMSRTERLFESRRSNKAFIADLEGFIQAELINCESKARDVVVHTAPPHAGSFQEQCYYAFVASSVGGTQTLIGIHEEDLGNRIEWTVMQIRERMKRSIRAFFSTSAFIG